MADGATIEDQIKQILEAEVRPMIAMHAGDVDFVSFENGVVNLRLKGTCKGCSASEITLKEGIGELLKFRLPAVERVESVA